jgi:hypothetical protein
MGGVRTVGYIRSEGLAGEGVHCAGLLEGTGVESLESNSGHTNRLSALKSTAERSDELSCET